MGEGWNEVSGGQDEGGWVVAEGGMTLLAH